MTDNGIDNGIDNGNEYTYEQCIEWINNPIVDPIDFSPVTELTSFKNLCINVLNKVKPLEIYNLNKDLYVILGLDDLFEETTIVSE